MNLLLQKKFLVPAVVVGSLVVSAVAFAAWTASGSGTATAAAASAQGLTISSPVTASGLFPTGSVSLQVQISNPNAYAVSVDTISQTAGQAISVDAGHSGCNVSSVTFNAAAGTGLAARVAASGTATVTLSNALAMSNSALDACQGATFTVPLSLSGASTT